MMVSGRQYILGSRILAILLLIGLPFFFYGGPLYHSARSYKAAWDLGHILFFTLLSLWLHDQLKVRGITWSGIRLFWTIFLVVFAVGLTVEIVQMLTTERSPDLFDLLRDLLGCLLAVAWLIRPPLLTGKRLPIFLRIAVVLLLAGAMWPLSKAMVDEYLAARQFPVLADFETPFERYRWNNVRQVQVENTTVRHGSRAMRVQLSTAKYSGIALFYFPHDWRGYGTLHWSVYNPQSDPLVLNCRIHDVHHKDNGSEFADRFNQQFVLQHGWNDLTVALERVHHAPKGRAMDMEHIEGFGLFVVQQASPMVIYLDHVYLGE
jgi:VanZ family protein